MYTATFLLIMITGFRSAETRPEGLPDFVNGDISDIRLWCSIKCANYTDGELTREEIHQDKHNCIGIFNKLRLGLEANAPHVDVNRFLLERQICVAEFILSGLQSNVSTTTPQAEAPTSSLPKHGPATHPTWTDTPDSFEALIATLCGILVFLIVAVVLVIIFLLREQKQLGKGISKNSITFVRNTLIDETEV